MACGWRELLAPWASALRGCVAVERRRRWRQGPTHAAGLLVRVPQSLCAQWDRIQTLREALDLLQVLAVVDPHAWRELLLLDCRVGVSEQEQRQLLHWSGQDDGARMPPWIVLIFKGEDGNDLLSVAHQLLLALDHASMSQAYRVAMHQLLTVHDAQQDMMAAAIPLVQTRLCLCFEPPASLNDEQEAMQYFESVQELVDAVRDEGEGCGSSGNRDFPFALDHAALDLPSLPLTTRVAETLVDLNGIAIRSISLTDAIMKDNSVRDLTRTIATRASTGFFAEDCHKLEIMGPRVPDGVFATLCDELAQSIGIEELVLDSVLTSVSPSSLYGSRNMWMVLVDALAMSRVPSLTIKQPSAPKPSQDLAAIRSAFWLEKSPMDMSDMYESPIRSSAAVHPEQTPKRSSPLKRSLCQAPEFLWSSDGVEWFEPEPLPSPVKQRKRQRSLPSSLKSMTLEFDAGDVTWTVLGPLIMRYASSLHSLTIRAKQMEPLVFNRILQICPQLRQLELCGLRECCMNALLMKSNRALRSLKLQSHSINNESLVRFATALSNDFNRSPASHLEELCLGSNRCPIIQNEPLQAFLSMLKTNKRLHRLELFTNATQSVNFGPLFKEFDGEQFANAFPSECKWAFLSAIGCRSAVEAPCDASEMASPRLPVLDTQTISTIFAFAGTRVARNVFVFA